MAEMEGVVLKTVEYESMDIRGIVFEVGQQEHDLSATPVLEDVSLPDREGFAIDVFSGEAAKESWQDFDPKKVFHVQGDIYAAVDGPGMALAIAFGLWQKMGSEKQRELLVKHGVISESEAVAV